jgi:hypothetical protein
MAAPVSPILLVLFLLAVALLWRRSKQPHNNLPLPPGPKRWPLIGSLLQMPKAFQHETYREWCRQFGEHSFPLYAWPSLLSLIELYTGSDIIYINVLGQSIVVIDKYETAVEILEKRSGIYSSRYVSVVQHPLLDGVKANT